MTNYRAEHIARNIMKNKGVNGCLKARKRLKSTMLKNLKLALFAELVNAGKYDPTDKCTKKRKTVRPRNCTPLGTLPDLILDLREKYSYAEISEKTGVCERTLQSIKWRKIKTTAKDKADRIKELWRTL